MIFSADFIVALVFRAIILYAAAWIPFIFALGLVLYVYVKRRTKANAAISLVVLQLVAIPIIVFDKSTNEGTYSFVYWSPIIMFILIVIWKKIAKRTLRSTEVIVIISIIACSSLTAYLAPIISRTTANQQRSIELQQFVDYLKSTNIEYYLPKLATDNSYDVYNSGDIFELKAEDPFTDIKYASVDRIEPGVKCPNFYTLDKPSKVDSPCVSRGKIGDFEVWTQAYPTRWDVYTFLYKDNTIIATDFEKNRPKDNMDAMKEVTEFASSLRPVSPEELAKYHYAY